MRLWHKDLISVLPRKQLLSQWRECCSINKSIKERGTPNHVLVNRILEYPLQHFIFYSMNVYQEIIRRGYKADLNKFMKYSTIEPEWVDPDRLFRRWHNRRYLEQCFRNLQEKFDCGAIPDNEWGKVLNKYFELTSG